MSLVRYTFFKSRPKVGEFKLWPLTAGRLILLEDHGNPLAVGDGAGDDPDPYVLYEALMVCSEDSEALAELSMLENTEWQLEVRKFGFDCSDEAINDFQAVIAKEMDAINKAEIKPLKKKRARKAGKRSARPKK